MYRFKTLEFGAMWETTSPSDKNGVALFESWISYDFNTNWTAKFGRQVLSYDNQRIMGGIDCLQQGQSHDAVLVTNKKNGYQLDFGAALNITTKLFMNLLM